MARDFTDKRSEGISGNECESIEDEDDFVEVEVRDGMKSLHIAKHASTGRQAGANQPHHVI